VESVASEKLENVCDEIDEQGEDNKQKECEVSDEWEEHTLLIESSVLTILNLGFWWTCIVLFRIERICTW